MKISYNYNRYPNSRAATEWSLIAGMLPAIGIFIIIGITVLGANLFGAVGGFVGFVLALCLVVFGTLFCKKMETKSAAKAAFKEKVGRKPTKEELAALILNSNKK